MAVASAKNKITLRPTGAFRGRDKVSAPATTTLAVAAAKGAATFTLTSATGITAGKWIRIGPGESGEPVQVLSVAGAVVTPVRPIMRDHAILEEVVEQTVYDLGRLSGVAQLTVSDGASDFEVEDRKLIYATLPGYFRLEMSLGLVGLTPYTLATALGIPITKVYGNGGHTTPLALDTDGSEIGTETNQWVIVQGVTMDGSPITIELWGADNDYTGVSLPMARGQGLSVPCKWVGAMACVEMNTYTVTPDTSLTSAKGDLLASIQEVGLFEPAITGPLATTTTALAAALAQTLALTAVTNLATDDFIRVNADDTQMEIHRVNNPATTTIVTKLYRSLPSGSAVTRLKQTPLGGIAKGSVTFNVGGSVEVIELENYNAAVGVKAGSATPSLGFTIVDFIATAIARALAVPQAEAAGGRFTTENAGTSPMAAIYLRGKNLSGNTVLFVLCGCTQQIQNVALALQKKGVGGLPYAVRPGSVVQLSVYS